MKYFIASATSAERVKSLSSETVNRVFRTGEVDMKNIMEYKGYLGSVEFSEEDEMFFGRVLGIRSLISYEGDNAKDLIADFHNSVDEYLKWCEDEGRKPEKAYKGSFNIRISPKLHKQLVICAMSHDMTLNGYIQEILERAVVL